MKIDIMFLVHNFQKFGAGFFHFSFFFLFELLVNNVLDQGSKLIFVSGCPWGNHRTWFGCPNIILVAQPLRPFLMRISI